jgi:hypothetical protein
MKRRDHVVDLGIDVRKHETSVTARAGFSRLRIGPSDRLF